MCSTDPKSLLNVYDLVKCLGKVNLGYRVVPRNEVEAFGSKDKHEVEKPSKGY